MITTAARSSEADQIILSLKFSLQSERDSVIALGILSCIENKVSAWTIISEVQDMIRENRQAMGRMLGLKLTCRILNF